MIEKNLNLSFESKIKNDILIIDVQLLNIFDSMFFIIKDNHLCITNKNGTRLYCLLITDEMRAKIIEEKAILREFSDKVFIQEAKIILY